MMYHINAPLPCEQRVLLPNLAQEVSAADAVKLPLAAFSKNFTDKNGHALAPRLADMAQRGNGVLLVNLAADARSLWLAQERPTQMAQGIAALHHAGASAEVVLCVPPSQNEQITILCEALSAQDIIPQIHVVPPSPVLREDTALYTALDTGTVRVHSLCAAFLSEGWQHRPCCVVDGETACAALIAAQGLPITKLVAVGMADGDTASVHEVPLGTKLSEICPPSAGAKAVLIGENPGVFASVQALAEEEITFSWRHDALTIYTADACMADCAANQLKVAASQSCHNCVLCREGSWHLEGVFTAITQGKAKRDDLALVEDIAPIIAQGALCSFGRTLAQTALTAVQTQSVRAELEAHILKKTCPTGVCEAFSSFVILPDKCTGCGDCLDACEEDAIEGKDGFIHMIDPDMCEKCGKCTAVCDENAIIRSAQKIRVPKKLTRVGRFS